MKNKKYILLILAVVLTFNTYISALGADVSYLPYVTSEMSDPLYWTQNSDVLADEDEIKTLNAAILSAKNTNMTNLKNHPETVDAIAINQALKSSTQADVSYYLGWTYLGNTTLATQEDFDPIIENTQNPYAQKTQKVRYAVAVKSTALRSFPSDTPIWDSLADKDLDYQYLVNIRVNEPLVITSESKDGKYLLAKGICCSGWVPSEDVAICADKEEWLSAWDFPSEKAVVIYGDKVRTEVSVTGSKRSELLFTMGTVLESAEIESPNVLIDNRAAYQNYVVYVPVRNEDGTYAKAKTLISQHQKVSMGYLPLTETNIAKVAFSALGNTYGWGGSLFSDDCSGYVRNIYKCFGLELARNTSWQIAMPVTGVDMDGMCREERIKFLDALPFGSVLFFNGHEMMYLGSRDGKYYVISAVGSIVLPFENVSVQRIRSTVINTLDIKRGNGLSWLDNLTYANVPYKGSEGENILPPYSWYHDGVKYCIQKKYMKGFDDGLFYPENEITKAQLLQLLYNTDELKEETTDAEKEWYADALSWAAYKGIITEDEEKAFEPDSSASREETVTFIYRYAKYKGYDAEEEDKISAFVDSAGLSKEAYEAFCYAVGNGIVVGKTENTLNPEENVTRAEIATIIKRFLTQEDIKSEE